MPDRRLADSALLRAARGLPVPRTPVWFMRQAGRSLPEYRRARGGLPMLESCRRPELVVEITLQPVRRYGVDAAILFSDIVLPLKAAGLEVDIVANVGPVVSRPVATEADVAAVPNLDPSQLEFLTESVRLLVAELGDTPLIGFAGAPFTLASYLVEGGPSRDHARTKALMHAEPDLWDALLRKVAGISAVFAEAQVAAGASAIQLFDSWAGALCPADYRRHAMPYAASVLARVGDLGVPRIHFGVGTGELLGSMGEAGAEVVGVDWRVPLGDAIDRVGGRAVQGNLDPALALAPTEVMLDRATEIVAAGRRAPGHIFNLGHGVLPSTDPDQLARLVDHVHAQPR
jgi:uroporphyrinogen decarboxylase